MKVVRFFLFFLRCNILVTVAINLWFPEYIHYFVIEDSFVENASAAFFFCAFLLGIFFLKKTTHPKKCMLVSFFGLVGFLDELSFGERVFGLSCPRILTVKIDALHDVVSLVYFMLSKTLEYDKSTAFPLGICAILSGVLLYRLRPKSITIRSIVSPNPLTIFPLLFGGLISLALVLDLNIVQGQFFQMLEEVFEMNAGVVLVCYCICLRKPTKIRQGLDSDMA